MTIPPLNPAEVATMLGAPPAEAIDAFLVTGGLNPGALSRSLDILTSKRRHRPWARRLAGRMGTLRAGIGHG